LVGQGVLVSTALVAETVLAFSAGRVMLGSGDGGGWVSVAANGAVQLTCGDEDTSVKF